MSITCVPQVVRALFDMFDAAKPSTVDGQPIYVSTSIGPPPGGDIPTEFLAVAYGGNDRPGVMGVAIDAGNHNTGEYSAEDFDVWVTISTVSGDQDGDAQMLVTQTIFDACADALAANPKLSGVLKGESTAAVGTAEWVVEDGGSLCTLFFTVLCRARWVS